MRLLQALPRAAALVWATVCLLACSNAAAQPASKPTPDLIIFTNGDQLSGTLERGVGSSIIFKSDMAGEITVPLDKIKELRSSGSYAVLRKDIQPTRGNVFPGTIDYQNSTMTVLTPLGTPESVPAPQVAYIIDQPT